VEKRKRHTPEEKVVVLFREFLYYFALKRNKLLACILDGRAVGNSVSARACMVGIEYVGCDVVRVGRCLKKP
jgi:hypothetical protein